VRAAVGAAIKKLPPERWDTLIKSRPQSGTLMHKAANFLNLDTQEEIYQNLLSAWHEPPVKNPVQTKNDFFRQRFPAARRSFLRRKDDVLGRAVLPAR
jgi:hypothetical protein